MKPAGRATPLASTAPRGPYGPAPDRTTSGDPAVSVSVSFSVSVSVALPGAAVVAASSGGDAFSPAADLLPADVDAESEREPRGSQADATPATATAAAAEWSTVRRSIPPPLVCDLPCPAPRGSVPSGRHRRVGPCPGSAAPPVGGCSRGWRVPGPTVIRVAEPSPGQSRRRSPDPGPGSWHPRVVATGPVAGRQLTLRSSLPCFW
ncbi:hypothetical protein FAIPA1_490018 [Frankia sp. AiPs1]